MTEEQPVNQVQPQQPAEQIEGEEVEDEESEHLPFPNARVVKIIKSNLKSEHQLKREVKEGANVLLGGILADIAQTMDKQEFFTLSSEHFNQAARKYREIALNQKRIKRIQKVLEKQRAELDEIIAEIELETPPESVQQ
ncbi:MAG: hypothetical protein Q8R15_00590 [Candidatus Micrarchaeota archaeon]|nr:hypothetical protein [Candidatus Micrarchaeota archaeon]